MIFTNTYFIEDLMKTTSENKYFQPTTSKYVCPNFEQ